MKKLKLIPFIISLTLILLIFTGCGSSKRLLEDKIYQEKIDSFFSALENQDSTALKSLFSQTVIEKDVDLDSQIEKLVSIYPLAKTDIKFNGLQSGEYETQDGKFKSSAHTVFPIICDGQYFWVYFELIYEDDFAEDNIGLNRVFFYTSDEYCALFHNDKQLPDDIGLVVFSNLKLENEVRPIEGQPYEFTAIDRKIYASDVENFLNKNRNLDEFYNKFGLPNAKGILWTYYYEITETDGTTKYLEIGCPNGDEIAYANIVSEFEFIRSVIKENKQ